MMYSISRLPPVALQVRNTFRHKCCSGPLISIADLITGSSSKTPKAMFYYSRHFCSKNSARSSEVRQLQRLPASRRNTMISAFLRFYSAEKSALKDEHDVKDGKLEQTEESSRSVSKELENAEAFEYEEENGLILTDEEIQELTDGDPELIKKIKYIQLEHVVLRQEGNQVPSKIRFKHWKELLPLDSKNKRKRYYIYLFKTEMKQFNDIRRKEVLREERMKEYAENPLPSREEDIYGMFYGLARNTIFLRLYEQSISKVYHNRVCSAMLHNPPLVIDCSYDEFMNPRESKNCAKQLELLITENRNHPEPYNLYLCNAYKRSPTMEYLRKIIPTIDDDGFVINIHEESFMDLFPKKRLVYLTPHTRDDLDDYNEDDIYIIGGMVDKTDPRPYSMAKAKKLNITMRRLPLDKHLMWGTGGKSLTLNQMVRIMLDVRHTRGDWSTALKKVPMRKLNREFHPYPDQVQREDSENLSSRHVFPQRYEKKSQVFADFELLNKRKGFRRSDTGSSRAPKMRSLFNDDN